MEPTQTQANEGMPPMNKITDLDPDKSYTVWIECSLLHTGGLSKEAMGLFCKDNAIDAVKRMAGTAKGDIDPHGTCWWIASGVRLEAIKHIVYNAAMLGFAYEIASENLMTVKPGTVRIASLFPDSPTTMLAYEVPALAHLHQLIHGLYCAVMADKQITIDARYRPVDQPMTPHLTLFEYNPTTMVLDGKSVNMTAKEVAVYHARYLNDSVGDFVSEHWQYVRFSRPYLVCKSGDTMIRLDLSLDTLPSS